MSPRIISASATPLSGANWPSPTTAFYKRKSYQNFVGVGDAAGLEGNEGRGQADDRLRPSTGYHSLHCLVVGVKHMRCKSHSPRPSHGESTDAQPPPSLHLGQRATAGEKEAPPSWPGNTTYGRGSFPKYLSHHSIHVWRVSASWQTHVFMCTCLRSCV